VALIPSSGTEWMRVTEDFMKRTLGFPKGKLLIISAIAAILHPMFNERQEHVVYLAGLCISLADSVCISHSFLWYTEVASIEAYWKIQRPTWDSFPAPKRIGHSWRLGQIARAKYSASSCYPIPPSAHRLLGLF
jgi:hypothetical protein